jgi:hypothetical protein
MSDATAEAAGTVVGQIPARRPVIDALRQFRGGGKTGRVCIKAPLELRDRRWVAANPQDDPKTPERAVLQKALREEPHRFRERLDELELEHAAAVARAKARKRAAEVAASESVAVSVQEPEVVVPVVEVPEPVVPPVARPRALSDPEKFAGMVARLEDMQYTFREVTDTAVPVRMWSGLFLELDWLVREVNHLGGCRDLERLGEVRAFVARMRRRHARAVREGGFVLVALGEVVSRMDWCVEQIETLLSQPGAD